MALQKTTGLAALAADELGCTVRTVNRYAVRYAAVREARLHMKEKRKDIAEGKLWGLINDGNITAIIFYLKTQAKDRGYVERIEQTGLDGQAIPICYVNNWRGAANAALGTADGDALPGPLSLADGGQAVAQDDAGGVDGD